MLLLLTPFMVSNFVSLTLLLTLQHTSASVKR